MSNIIEVTNPYNGEFVGKVPIKSGDEILTMVKAAKKAQKVWAMMPLYERSRILYKFCEIFEQNVEDIARIESLEMGKPITQSRAEVSGSVRIFRAFIERANHLYGKVFPTDNQPGMHNDVIFTKREPLGIVSCIIPFNYPVELCIYKVAPALIMGNTVLVKVPTSNPLAVCMLEDMFYEAGLYEDVIRCFACKREDSMKYMVSNPDISAVSMTGSTQSGVKIAEAGASTLKHIFLELGGNDANIVFEDADINYAAQSLIEGRILPSAGQACCTSKRCIVHRSRQTELIEKLIESITKLKTGCALNPDTIVSCLVSEKAAKVVEEQINLTLKQGAKLALGGNRNGAFIEPTILYDITKDMDVAADMEIFGPVLSLIPFNTEEEAIEIANLPQYGLSSGLFTKDITYAMSIAPKIEAGAVVLNGSSLYRHMEQGFGGYKMTGLGREGVGCSLEEFSQVKNYVIKNVFIR